MTYHRARYLADALQVAKEQVEGQKVLGHVKSHEEACILAEYIVNLYDLEKPMVSISAKPVLVSWLFGLRPEMAASDVIMYLTGGYSGHIPSFAGGDSEPA